MTSPLLTLLSPQSVLVRDSFDRPDNASSLGLADTGQTWTALSGTWGVSSGRAYSATDGDGNLVVIDPRQPDVVVSMLFVGTHSGATPFRVPQLICRATDTNNWLLADIYNGSVRLIKRLSGSASTLATAALATVDGTTYRLTVRAVGPTINVLVDDTQRISWPLTGGDATAFAAPSLVGLRLASGGGAAAVPARFDNFLVTRP